MHKLYLADGSCLSSGALPALQKVSLTQRVNTGQALAFGSVFSACLEATLLAGENPLPMGVGEQITLYREDSKLGVFWIHSLQKTGKGIYKLLAYDALSLLDKDVTTLLESLQHWPYTLQELAAMVCDRCGLTLAEAAFPNGEFPVQPFSGKGVTGRQLLSWIAQAAGCFCRANPHGQAELTWYTNAEICLEPTGECFYYQGSFHREEKVQPVDKVCIRREQTDVGTGWPSDGAGKNVFVVEGNPLLSAQNGETLLPVAKTLYERLAPITYTPATVSVPAGLGIVPGQILTAKDREGESHTLYIMGCVSSGGRQTLSCTGVQNREQESLANRQDIRSLSGKLLHLQMDVDGIAARNEDAAGNLAQLQLQLEGIRTQVRHTQEDAASLKTQMTALEQEKDKLTLRISQVEEGSASSVTTQTGYRFDEKGLWISKTGEEMENRLDQDGMSVRRAGQVILQANSRGVEAVDVTVGNYLTIGSHARLEDYGAGRTACFYIGGNDDGM